MKRFDPRIPRPLAISLGREAVKISLDGWFENGHGPVNISDDVSRSIQKTKYYAQDYSHEQATQGPHQTVYEVKNETTLSAHLRHLDSGYNVVSLNFASATSPGGGFLTGSRAQEEYLCRSSALYLTLKDCPMYEYHRNEGHSLYSDAMVYSPDVPVFRHDEHFLLSDVYLASFITSPAPMAKHLGQSEIDQLPEILRQRIHKILSVAQKNGHDSIILGAWGCGAFGNDGHQVAGLFKHALSHDYAGTFKMVTFAIVDTSPDLHFISPFAAKFSPNN